MDVAFARKIFTRRAWSQVAQERLTEPLHIQGLSLIVALLGSFRARVQHDLIPRPHNAYAILRCADLARSLGLQSVSLAEFGVASGAGLINMARIAERVTRITGVAFRIYGFDTGAGMPAPVDYRDHPDLYGAQDFPMDARLRSALPSNVSLIIGDVAHTAPKWVRELGPDAPLGYAVFDLDYYSSTRGAMSILADADPAKYLPLTLAYFDDIDHERHNSKCGERLAISEFNAAQQMRHIERDEFLADRRVYRRAAWLKRMFNVHVLDHAHRNRPIYDRVRSLENPYLGGRAVQYTVEQQRARSAK